MTLDDILGEPEFAPFVRRWFFDQLAAGLLAPDRAREIARRLDMELCGPEYALALLELPLQPSDAAGFFSDPAGQVRSGLLAYFMKYSEYELIPCGPELSAVLIQGGRMPDLIRRCVETVRTQFERGGLLDWHVAVSGPVSRLEDLPDCWREVSRLWALRFTRPEVHILRPGAARRDTGPGDERALLAAGPAGADPAPVRAFLATGHRADAGAFAEEYLSGLAGALAFRPFRHYVVLTVRFAAGQAVSALGAAPEQLYSRLGPWTEPGDQAEVRQAVEDILAAALDLRDETAGADRPGPLGLALGYIHSRIGDPSLSLSAAAGYAGITPSYLSALFRRELGRTFTGYVTEKRLELARRLLRTTAMPAGHVARAAGFKDPHYFSALFKKHFGCPPTAYRDGALSRPDGERPPR